MKTAVKTMLNDRRAGSLRFQALEDVRCLTIGARKADTVNDDHVRLLLARRLPGHDWQAAASETHYGTPAELYAWATMVLKKTGRPVELVDQTPGFDGECVLLGVAQVLGAESMSAGIVAVNRDGTTPAGQSATGSWLCLASFVDMSTAMFTVSADGNVENAASSHRLYQGNQVVETMRIGGKLASFRDLDLSSLREYGIKEPDKDAEVSDDTVWRALTLLTLEQHDLDLIDLS
jgi:hypothetical protein